MSASTWNDLAMAAFLWFLVLADIQDSRSYAEVEVWSKFSGEGISKWIWASIFNSLGTGANLWFPVLAQNGHQRFSPQFCPHHYHA